MRRIALAAVYFLILIGFLDQLLNILASKRTFAGINAGVEEMAAWLKENAGAGAIIVTNFGHGLDISMLAANNSENYWTVDIKSYPFRSHILTNRNDFSKVIDSNLGSKEIYVLMQDCVSHKYSVGRPPYLDDYADRMEFMKQFHVVARYPFLDPLKMIVQRVSFGGPADLTGYFNTKRGFFYGECSAVYDLFKMR